MRGLASGMALLLLSGSAGSFGEQSVWWSAKAPVRQASEIAAAMAKPWDSSFAVRRGGESATVTNCASSLDLQAKGFQAVSEREGQALQSMTVSCLAMRLMKGAKPARTTALAGLRWDASALSRLPPSAGIVVSKEDQLRVREAAAKGQSWKQFEPLLKAQSAVPDELSVRGDGWRVTLTLLGKADFDADGWEDLLVEARGALSGSYRSVRLLLFTSKQPAGVLQLTREVTP